MKFCEHCGAPRKEGAKFCTACGHPFPTQEAAAPAVIPETVKTPEPVNPPEPAKVQEPVKAPEPEKAPAQPKKKRTGLIIGIIGCLLALAAGVFLALHFFGDKPDDKDDHKATTTTSGVEKVHAKKAKSNLLVFNGDYILVYRFKWTNNGDEPAMAADEVEITAHQDGEKLEKYLLSDDNSFYETVKPGETAEIAVGFLLYWPDEEVEVTVSSAGPGKSAVWLEEEIDPDDIPFVEETPAVPAATTTTAPADTPATPATTAPTATTTPATVPTVPTTVVPGEEGFTIDMIDTDEFREFLLTRGGNEDYTTSREAYVVMKNLYGVDAAESLEKGTSYLSSWYLEETDYINEEIDPEHRYRHFNYWAEITTPVADSIYIIASVEGVALFAPDGTLAAICKYDNRPIYYAENSDYPDYSFYLTFDAYNEMLYYCAWDESTGLNVSYIADGEEYTTAMDFCPVDMDDITFVWWDEDFVPAETGDYIENYIGSWYAGNQADLVELELWKVDEVHWIHLNFTLPDGSTLYGTTPITVYADGWAEWRFESEDGIFAGAFNYLADRIYMTVYYEEYSTDTTIIFESLSMSKW